MEKENPNIKKSLECPVCLEIMQIPIHMCLTGHNICTTCKQKLPNCPFCKNGWSNVRNIGLERLANALQNSNGQCSDKESTDDAIENEDLSESIDRSCPIQDVHKCKWKGPVSEIETHLSAYGTFIYTAGSVSIIQKPDYTRSIVKQDSELFRVTMKKNIHSEDFTTWSFEHISAKPYKNCIYRVIVTFKDQINNNNDFSFTLSCPNWLNVEKDSSKSIGISLSRHLLKPFVGKDNEIISNWKFEKNI